MSAVSSIGLAATTNWIIKDGFGLLGGVLFASLGSRFDAKPKLFRFYSGILIQFSTVLELLTPLFPSYFLPMASLLNAGKNIEWLASSATVRRSFNYQARFNASWLCIARKLRRYNS